MAISTASPSLSPAPQTPQSTEGAPGPVSPSAMQTVDLPPPVDGLSGGSDSKANSAAPAASQPKRKPSRRASTAERRATHNAVERARRETLNSRFLVSIFSGRHLIFTWANPLLFVCLFCTVRSLGDTLSLSRLVLLDGRRPLYSLHRRRRLSPDTDDGPRVGDWHLTESHQGPVRNTVPTVFVVHHRL